MAAIDLGYEVKKKNAQAIHNQLLSIKAALGDFTALPSVDKVLHAASVCGSAKAKLDTLAASYTTEADMLNSLTAYSGNDWTTYSAEFATIRATALTGFVDFVKSNLALVQVVDLNVNGDPIYNSLTAGQINAINTQINSILSNIA